MFGFGVERTADGESAPVMPVHGIRRRSWNGQRHARAERVVGGGDSKGIPRAVKQTKLSAGGGCDRISGSASGRAVEIVAGVPSLVGAHRIGRKVNGESAGCGEGIDLGAEPAAVTSTRQSADHLKLGNRFERERGGKDEALAPGTDFLIVVVCQVYLKGVAARAESVRRKLARGSYAGGDSGSHVAATL